MKIESIELNNIRSYESEKVDLEDGLILLYGENGAGKSSLLSSIFSGLFMSDVMKYMDGDVNLDSIVNKDAEEGQINLIFSINGDEYEIEWVISVRETEDGRQASTDSCKLEGTDLNETVEGVRAVKDTVQDIMGLGPESFINSVYVQQGDITRMVNADEDKRKEIIDGLLGLSKLDKYIDRMDKARLEYGAQKRQIDGLLNEKERQLSEYNTESEIRDEIENLKNKKKSLEDKKEELVEDIKKAESNISRIDTKLNNYKEKKKDLENAKSELKNKKERKNEIEDKRSNLEKELEAIEREIDVVEDDLRQKCEEYDYDRDEQLLKEEKKNLEEKIQNLNNEVTKLKEGDIRSVKNQIEQIDSDMDRYESNIEENESKISDITGEISNIEEKINSLEDEIGKLKRAIGAKENKIVDITDKLGIEYDSLEALRDLHIPDFRDKQTENLIESCKSLGMEIKEKEIYDLLNSEGECPICGEDSDIDVVDHIDEHDEKIKDLEERVEYIRNQNERLDELEKLINSVQELRNNKEIKDSELEQMKNKKSSKESDLDRLESSIEDLKNDIQKSESEKEDLLEKIDSLEKESKNKKEELDSLVEEKERVEDIISKIESLEDLSNETSSREQEIEKFAELKSNLQEQFIEKKQKVKELKDETDDTDVADLQNKKGKFKDIVDKYETEKSEVSDKISRTQQMIAERKQDLKTVKDINERINELEDMKIEATEQEADAEDTIDKYKSVKAQLRKENIGLLNKYANEIFNSVYNNKVYQRMEISEDYDITLVTGDNMKISPEDLSGGEKTIVSLAIRAGVYKLLVERQGSADTLPPFILDEPTTFLDSSHVSNLQDVIETITSWDVPQILIVSHREDMIQNADSGYRVEKDPATETSSVKKEY